MREKISWYLRTPSVFCCSNAADLAEYIKYRDRRIESLIKYVMEHGDGNSAELICRLERLLN